MTPEQRREERVKLFANYLNIVAAGCAVGALVTAPLAATKTGQNSLLALVIYQVSFFVLSLSLHLVAQRILRRL